MLGLRIQSSICLLLFAVVSQACGNNLDAQDVEKALIEEAFSSILEAPPLPGDVGTGVDQLEANESWIEVAASRNRIFELLMKSQNKAECAEQIVAHWKILESDFDQFKIFSTFGWTFHNHAMNVSVGYSFSAAFLDASDALNRQLVEEYVSQTDFSRRLLRMTVWLRPDYLNGDVDLGDMKAIRKHLERRKVTDWEANRILMEIATLLGEQKLLLASSDLDSFDWVRLAIILEAEVYRHPKGFGFDKDGLRLRPIWPLQYRELVDLETPLEGWPANVKPPSRQVFSQYASETVRDAIIPASRVEPTSKEQAIAAAALQEIGFENWGQKRGKVLTMLIRQEKRDALVNYLEIDEEGRVSID